MFYGQNVLQKDLHEFLDRFQELGLSIPTNTTPLDITSLLDSISRGYPIGMIIISDHPEMSIVDGNRRISSLFEAFRKDSAWKYSFAHGFVNEYIYNDAVPLHVVLDRVALNTCIRVKGLNENQARVLEKLRLKLREYLLPVQRIVTTDLDQLQEIRMRLNNRRD